MKNFGELVSEVRQEPTALEEGKKPNSMGPGWMLKADPKLGKAVADAVAKAKEKRRLVGSKTEPVKEEVKEPTGDLKDACWKGYTAVGMKNKNGKKVPNCVPVKEDVEQLDEMPGANMDTRAVHQHLKKQGWKLTRTSGSHDVFTHPDAKHHIPVPRHRQLKAPLVKGILKQASVNEETDTTEKTEMAQTQLHFIKYAADEILEYIEMGGEIEEWYQNKLSKVQSDVESLHSYVEGESRRTGMKEEVDPAHKKVLDKAKTSTPKSPKGEYDRKVEKYLKKKYTKEEVEQIDELSKDTVQSYVGKAKTNYATQRKRMSRAYYQDVDKYDDATVKSDARKAGIKAAKARLAKEEVELTEEKDYHSVHVNGRHWKTFDTKSHAENVAKKIKGATVQKYDAERLQQNYAAKSSARNAARGKQWDEAVEVGQMSNSNENPNAGRFISGPAKKPMKPTPIVTAEQTASNIGEPRTEVPFAGPYVHKTTKVVTDKSGAKHTPMSRVKHLAKMAARKQAGLKEEEEKQDSYEKTNTQAKRSLSKNAGMVKDLANKAKSAKKAAPETFQAEPELSSQIVKV